jgi:hypothetical protein
MPKPIAYPLAAAIILIDTLWNLLEALILPPSRHTHFYGPYH